MKQAQTGQDSACNGQGLRDATNFNDADISPGKVLQVEKDTTQEFEKNYIRQRCFKDFPWFARDIALKAHDEGKIIGQNKRRAVDGVLHRLIKTIIENHSSEPRFLISLVDKSTHGLPAPGSIKEGLTRSLGVAVVIDH